MAKAGLVDHEIAGELGVSERTILRDRKAANIPTGYDPFMRMPRLKSKDGRRAS
jgi:predicted DNA-binding transcriptional regulator YafY